MVTKKQAKPIGSGSNGNTGSPSPRRLAIRIVIDHAATPHRKSRMFASGRPKMAIVNAPHAINVITSLTTFSVQARPVIKSLLMPVTASTAANARYHRITGRQPRNTRYANIAAGT